jgi:hypothetical protein
MEQGQAPYEPTDLNQFVASYEKAFGPDRTGILAKKLGPLKHFMAYVLGQELDLKVHKLERMEKSFGIGSFQLTKGYQPVLKRFKKSSRFNWIPMGSPLRRSSPIYFAVKIFFSKTLRSIVMLSLMSAF